MQGAWREVLGPNGNVELLEDALEGSIALGFLLDFKGQLLKVRKGTRPVSLLVILIRLDKRQARRCSSGYGLVGGEARQQVRSRRGREGGSRALVLRADVFVHGEKREREGESTKGFRKWFGAERARGRLDFGAANLDSESARTATAVSTHEEIRRCADGGRHSNCTHSLRTNGLSRHADTVEEGGREGGGGG